MIYLDHASTTPIDERVRAAMEECSEALWGNPSSPHQAGRLARVAIDGARKTVADAFHVQPHEVIFVSSGSEANSLAIFGSTDQWKEKYQKPGHLILSAVEHSCSMKVVEKLKLSGWDVTLLPVGPDGRVQVETLQKEMKPDTALVSIQWANNEVGTIQPVEEIYDICREFDVPFHTDAVQIIGQLALPNPLPCDMLSIAAHKFYGPKGIGALIIRDAISISPQILGGGQEFGIRAGTENTPAIVGMAEALKLCTENLEHEASRLTELRDNLIARLTTLPGVRLNGSQEDRLPNNVNIYMEGRRGEDVVIALDLDDICCSTGSACATGATEPSHVLQAMGSSRSVASENLRISLGKSTSQEDIDAVFRSLEHILINSEALAIEEK